MTFAARVDEVGKQRKGGMTTHAVIIIGNSVFFSLLCSILLMKFYDFAYFAKQDPRPLSGWEVLAAIALFLLGILLSFIDFRYPLTRLGSFFNGSEGWFVGLGVDVYFDWIEKMADENKTLEADQRFFGLTTIGLVLCQISLSFLKDPTGLTGGAFISSMKLLTAYKYKGHSSANQWHTVNLVIFTCILCMFTEKRDAQLVAAAGHNPPTDSTSIHDIPIQSLSGHGISDLPGDATHLESSGLQVEGEAAITTAAAQRNSSVRRR